MDFMDRCVAWFFALPDDLQAEVRGMIGIIPDWMVASLAIAAIPVIPIEMTGGRQSHGYLMPTALMMFLAEPERFGDGRSDSPHESPILGTTDSASSSGGQFDVSPGDF